MNTFEEIQQLEKYIAMLTNLLNAGYKCEKELNEAMVLYKKASLPKLAEKNKNVVQTFEDYFSISNTEHGRIVMTTEDDRGVGKTTSLINKSVTYRVPILVCSGNSKTAILSRNSGPNSPDVVVCNNIDNIRGITFAKGVLIEEGFTFGQIEEIKDAGIILRGGYVYTGYSRLFV